MTQRVAARGPDRRRTYAGRLRVVHDHHVELLGEEVRVHGVVALPDFTMRRDHST
jgi:hypothetical protein